MPGIDAFTKLYLKGGESNLSTTIVDSSPSPKSGTCFGGCVASTAQAKFTSSSLLLASSGYLKYDDDADWDFGTADFTIDMWAYFLGTSNDLIARADADFRWRCSASDTLILNLGGVSIKSESTTWSNNQWYHIAVSRSGTNLRFFKDGVELGTATTNSTDITYASPLYIGSDEGIYTFFNGYFAGVRWSKGVARYTTDFTPPTDVYTVDALVKTVDGLAYASVKTIDGLAVASVKSRNGLTTQ